MCSLIPDLPRSVDTTGLTSDTASQYCMVWLNALTRHLQPQVIKARERAQIRAIKDSIGHVEVFQMDGGNPHHRKTSTPTRPRHAQPRQQHLHPQIRRAWKPWHWAQVRHLMRERGPPVVFQGGPSDQRQCVSYGCATVLAFFIIML